MKCLSPQFWELENLKRRGIAALPSLIRLIFSIPVFLAFLTALIMASPMLSSTDDVDTVPYGNTFIVNAPAFATGSTDYYCWHLDKASTLTSYCGAVDGAGTETTALKTSELAVQQNNATGTKYCGQASQTAFTIHVDDTATVVRTYDKLVAAKCSAKDSIVTDTEDKQLRVQDWLAVLSQPSNVTAKNALYKRPVGLKFWDMSGLLEIKYGDDYEHTVSMRARFVKYGSSVSGALNGSGRFVVMDLWVATVFWSWVFFVLFAALIVLLVLRTIQQFLNLDNPTEAQSGFEKWISWILSFLTSFEDVSAAQDVLEDIGEGGAIKQILKWVLGNVFTLIRDGYSVFATSIIVTLIYAVLTVFEGDCDTLALSGGCMVQWGAIQQKDLLIIFVIVFTGRLASGYNFRDRSIEITSTSLEDKEKNQGWFSGLSKQFSSLTVQFLATGVSVLCSVVTLFLIMWASEEIGVGRRPVFAQLAWFVGLIEIIHVGLNVGVFVLSAGLGISDTFKDMKLYVEGKMFSALYFACGVIVLYMTLRQAINMYGSHVVDQTASNPNALATTQYYDDIAIRQLSKAGHDFCHYIPRLLYDDKSSHTFDSEVCVYSGTCCSAASFDDSDQYNGHSAFAAGFVVIAIVILVHAILGGLAMIWVGFDDSSQSQPNRKRSFDEGANGFTRRRAVTDGFRAITVV